MSVSIPDCFMTALLAGFLFGSVYEALRIVRLVLRLRAAVFVCDIVFFVLAAFLVVRLSVNLGNYIRVYTVLGFGAGVFAYITTIGRFFNMLESAASVVWRKTIGRALRKIGCFWANLFGKIAYKTKAGFVKAAEYWKEKQKNRHNALHLSRKNVYNIKGRYIDRDKIGEGENNVIKADVRRGLQ